MCSSSMGPPPEVTMTCNATRSLGPRQDLLQFCKELLPARVSAAIGLLLVRPEARLLDAQVRPRACGGEREGDHALQVEGGVLVIEIPGVGQRLVWLDGKDLAVEHAAPFSAQIEAMAYGRLEIVLHEPLLDQMRLRQSAPELLRRMRKFPFDDGGSRLGRSVVHWSILFSRSSS